MKNWFGYCSFFWFLLLELVRGKIESKSFPGPTLYDDYLVMRLAPGYSKNPQIGPLFEYSRHKTIRDLSYHLLRLDNPIGHLHIITARDEGCPGRATISETARRVGCRAALNAGFFDMITGDCIGNVVSQSHLYQISGLRNTNIGWTGDGRLLMGYLTKDSVQKWPWVNLVSGLLWLVRDGYPFWKESNEIEGPDFIEMRAPRSILGTDPEGRVYLLMVEGVEIEESSVPTVHHTTDKEGNDQLPLGSGPRSAERHAIGLTIPELTDLIISLGLTNAVNLDGGGSSNFFLNGQVVNKLSDRCLDDPASFCERPVTTIICVK